MWALSHQQIKRNKNSYTTQLVKLMVKLYVCYYEYILLLASDTDVSSKPLTDHGKQEQLHYTTGEMIKAVMCLILLVIFYQ